MERLESRASTNFVFLFCICFHTFLILFSPLYPDITSSCNPMSVKSLIETCLPLTDPLLSYFDTSYLFILFESSLSLEIETRYCSAADQFFTSSSESKLNSQLFFSEIIVKSLSQNLLYFSTSLIYLPDKFSNRLPEINFS